MKQAMKPNVVVITGASSGIGHALAAHFAAMKETVVYNLDIVADDQSGERVKYIACDIRQAEQIEAAMAQILSEQKTIHTFIANAGVHLLSRFIETTQEQFMQVVNTNLLGTFQSLQKIIPVMRDNQYGRIVLMGSEQALIGREWSSIYAMTKAGIVQLAKSLSAEYVRHGIRVNALCPAVVEGTDITNQAAEKFAKEWNVNHQEALAQFKTELPIGKMVDKASLCRWVDLLCSREFCDVSGGCFTIDGGFTSQK